MAKGWILVTEVESGKRARQRAVRISSIDVIEPRQSYRTLWVHGSYLHVKETFDELIEMIEMGEKE